MTNIDQFESIFKSAAKTPFEFVPVHTRSMLLVMDAEGDTVDWYRARVERFLKSMGDRAPADIYVLERGELGTVSGLLEAVDRYAVDLVCTYRNLRIPATEHPYSLGVYVDVLSQVASAPLLLLPRPEVLEHQDDLLQNTREVMAVTDNLTGDHRLVNYAAHFTAAGGKLILSHIEDMIVFERYMDVISKLPAIETETARHDVLEQLLKEPRDYIASCRKALEEANHRVDVGEIVRLGKRLDDYKALIAELGIDLIVLHTKDADQLAMHGYAYPLAVELRTVPLLLL